MKKHSLVILMLTMSFVPQAQSLLSEITPGKATVVKDIRGMIVDNDIFLTVNFLESPTGTVVKTKSYWIHADGTQKEIDLKPIEDKALIAVSTLGDSVYYYYLEESKKTFVIRAWVWSSQTGSGKTSGMQIDLPGKLFGNYIDQGSLYLVCALKGSYSLRLVQIQGMQVYKETNFSLSFDLGKNKKAAVSYFSPGAMATTSQASASIKITKEENTIWITADEPMRDYDRTVEESSLFKTSVVRLDPATGQASTKVFFDPSHNYFNSTLFDGNLYRVLQDDGLRMDVFNFENGKKVHSMKMPSTVDHDQDMAYSRLGSKRTISKRPVVRQIVKSSFPNFVIADSTSSNEVVLTLGTYAQDTPGAVPVVPTFGLIGALISLASTVAIHELSSGYLYHYFYLKGTIDSGFHFTNETNLTRQRIDEYEIKQQAEKIVFKYKGYLADSSGVYAIYQQAKSPHIQILKFEK